MHGDLSSHANGYQWFMKFKSSPASDKSRQLLVSFSISVSAHIGFGLALAFILVRSHENSTGNIIASIASEDASNEIREIEFTPLPQTQMPDVPEQPVFEVARELAANAPMEPTISDSLLSITPEFHKSITSQAAMASLASGAFKSESTPSKSKSSTAKATFFGAEAYGNRFVFVIDSSGSMRGPRWAALCRELIRAIQSLSPDQRFFILSFDSSAHSMFGLVPQKEAFLNPTQENVANVWSWLVSIQHGSSTLPATAVGIAMKLEPDAIFLLSDGEIADSTVQDLRFWNHKKEKDGNVKTLIPIHTVLLHSQIGFVALQTIANENSGTFTPVRPF